MRYIHGSIGPKLLDFSMPMYGDQLLSIIRKHANQLLLMLYCSEERCLKSKDLVLCVWHFCYLKGLYLCSRFTINPDKVYRMDMRRLYTSAGILEVMGAPLTGTDLRAYVMSGGGLTVKNFKPSFRSKRCFLIFPIQGSERKGLVSVEVKNKKGQVYFFASHSPFISHMI